jgi:hypothetical protein
MSRPDFGSIAVKFEEIQTVLQTTKNEKTAQKLYKELKRQSLRVPDSSQFERAAAMILARFSHDSFSAVQIARKLAPIATDPSIVREIAGTFQDYLLDSDLLAFHARLHKDFPHEVTFLDAYFINLLATGKYAEAQQLGLTMIRLHKSIPHILYEAFAAFLLAEHTGSSLFYQFVPRFIDEANTFGIESIVRLKVKALIKLNRAEEALTFLRSEAISGIFETLNIAARRLEIEVLQVLGNTAEIGIRAVEFLENVESDSLEEWRLALHFYPDIDSLFTKYDDGRHRSVGLMKIEKAIKQGEDVLPSITADINQNANKSWTFSDIKNYLNDNICVDLITSEDIAVRTFAKNVFDDEIVNPRTATIAAQFALLKYIETHDREILANAVAAIIGFDSPSVKVMLLRLTGLLGDTIKQFEIWQDLRLEAISWLSCGVLVIPDLLRERDLFHLKKFYIGAREIGRASCRERV